MIAGFLQKEGGVMESIWFLDSTEEFSNLADSCGELINLSLFVN